MSQRGVSGIIGSVVERKPGVGNERPTKPASGPTSTGFPSVQHRSKSAFARNREQNLRKNLGLSKLNAPPIVSSSAQPRDPLSIPPPAPPAPSNDESEDALHDSISRENEARIAGMSPEEIEEEKQEILRRFGADIGSVLEKARRNRLKKNTETRMQRTKHTSPPPPPLEKSVVEMEEGAWISRMFGGTSHRQTVPISPEERSTERGSPHLLVILSLLNMI